MRIANACKMGMLALLCVLPIGCLGPSAGGAGASTAASTAASPAAATGGAGTSAAGAAGGTGATGAAGTSAAAPAATTTPAAAAAAPAAAGGGKKHGKLLALLKNSFLCKLLGQFLAPFSGLGGQNPGGLKMPSAQELNAPGAQGTAAKIKKETIESKQRREAVEFLGTVDCHYYPEAAVSMITSLRTDRTECVRWSAAIALGRGCCCNKKVIEALALTVSGSELDGNPAENSRRVREAARASLEKCLACYSAIEAKEENKPKVKPLPKPEQPTKPEGTQANPKKIIQMRYYEHSEERPIEVIYARARHALRMWELESRQKIQPRGEEGLIGLIREAQEPSAP